MIYSIQNYCYSLIKKLIIFAHINIVSNVSEPSSRDPMVESTSSGSSSDTNEPVCAQLLTQLNTAYQHLAPDAQALVSITKVDLLFQGFQFIDKKIELFRKKRFI